MEEGEEGEEEEEALLTKRSKEAVYKDSNLDFGSRSQCNKARSRKIQTVSFWTREEEKQVLTYMWHACLSVLKNASRCVQLAATCYKCLGWS